MLGAISWGVYVTVVMVLLGLWYGYLIIRYYPKKFNSIIKGRAQSSDDRKGSDNDSSPFSEFKESFSTLEDAEELHTKLLEAFTESNHRDISKTEFKHYLQCILAGYPFVKQSVLRRKINSLVMAESLKYPGFVLNTEEMDNLWEAL